MLDWYIVSVIIRPMHPLEEGGLVHKRKLPMQELGLKVQGDLFARVGAKLYINFANEANCSSKRFL